MTQASAQLRNIQTATGLTIEQFAEEIRREGLEAHGRILAHLKAAHGLTHGNANALAHAVREHLAGGPPTPEALLDAQYAGAKAPLREVYEAVRAIAVGLGDDVEVVVQKTGVTFRRRRVFAVARAASSTRVELGLKLDVTPDGGRVVETTGMCSHRVDLRDPSDVDDAVAGWLADAHAAAG
ncbi:DUF5655 domain-containing protein [Euzebya sp.]|uniref:DUF5655 domain-containing protein n=1 Tax=Euzebya sp. TaxID=1971409 RepID=UPI003518ECBE